jgi:hypothetical protein
VPPLDPDDEVEFPLRPPAAHEYPAHAIYRDGEKTSWRTIFGWSKKGVPLVFDAVAGRLVPAQDLPGFGGLGGS